MTVLIDCVILVKHLKIMFHIYTYYICLCWLVIFSALRRRGLIQGKGTTILSLLTLAMRINMSCTTTTLFAAYNSMPYFML